MDKRILIDTDPGIDDALALILALRSNLDIRAISVVAGNVELDQAFANARFLLSKLNSNLKPMPGLDKPLVKDLVTTLVHGKTGLGEIDIEPKDNLKSKIKEIVNIIKEQRINTIITLGPLTNIAKIIQISPELENQIKDIIIMGGAVNSKGNITPEAEFNIYVDPEAADFIFKTKIDKTLVPLGVCNKVVLTEKYFHQIKHNTIRETILKMIDEYIVNCRKQGFNGAPMYDPLTAYYAISKDAYTTKQFLLNVVTSGKKRGKTESSDGGNKINVVVDLDKDRFKKDFIDIIDKG